MTLEERLASGWVIDACATCGRAATFPFCAHRSEASPWTVAIAVKAIFPAAVRRAAANVTKGEQ